MFKLLLILIWSSIAVLNQVNIRDAGLKLNGTTISQDYKLWMVLFLRVGVIALVSLGITMWCYQYFGFVEFLVAQSLYYGMSLSVAYFILGQQVTVKDLVAVTIIFGGLGFYYA
jgi:hypothetical protein